MYTLTLKLCFQDSDKIRQWAVEQMCGVAAIRTAPAAIKTDVLKFLALHAFYTVEKDAYSKVISYTLPSVHITVCLPPRSPRVVEHNCSVSQFRTAIVLTVFQAVCICMSSVIQYVYGEFRLHCSLSVTL